jgi:hypothetical protein
MTESTKRMPLVSWDPDYGVATIIGPGGFTQIRIERAQAEAIARTLGIGLEVKAAIREPKPASGIANWNGWPEDVRETIRAWNNGRGLTFVRGGIFKCDGCEALCESHQHGRAELKGVPYCDDCLIEKARTDPKAGEVWRLKLDDLNWRGGGTMRHRRKAA